MIIIIVIVIAVIAILAAVLIPTFSGVVDRANESAALQEARNIYAEYLSEYDYVKNAEGPETDVFVELEDGTFVEIKNGTVYKAEGAKSYVVSELEAGDKYLSQADNDVWSVETAAAPAAGGQEGE